MTKETDRIPFDQWTNSQLSIARFSWWATINWKLYEYDREVVRQMQEDNDDNKLYKPDLVCYSDTDGN